MKKVNMAKLEAILNGLWNNEIKTYRLSVELANGNSTDIDRRVKSYGKIADNKKSLPRTLKPSGKN